MVAMMTSRFPTRSSFYTFLALLLISVTLFITSFKKIRFSMKVPAWQELRKWSYAFHFILLGNTILAFVCRLLMFQECLAKGPVYVVDTYLSLSSTPTSLWCAGAIYQDRP
ncbi:hypothetical protein ACUH96_02955 [Dermabacteraceae bacterium P13077]